MSEKHEAFLRLSEKRLESVEDAIRIWSNLSGPSYLFTVNEVMAAIERIQASLLTARARFVETKCWRDQVAALTSEEPEPELETEPVEAPAPAPAGGTATVTPRELEMLRIWAEPKSEEGGLLEMLAMQREMIAHLQAKIDAKEQA